MTNQTEEIDRIFNLQCEPSNLQRLKDTTANERLAKIRKIEKYLLDTTNRDKFIAALKSDLRKPADESLTNEYVPALLNITHVFKHLRSWMRDQYVDQPISLLGFSSRIRYEPKGVVLIVAPWNYPFQLVISPLIYAIAAGNAVIIKPSEIAGATAAFMSEMMRTLFPENEVAVIEGEAEVASSLLEKPFNHIFFTGSPAVGKIVMHAAAKNLASVTLELGGKSPVIVDETTNIKVAADKIVWAKTMNCGQTCIAPDYLLLHESKKSEFATWYQKAIDRFYSTKTTGLEKSPYLARIVNTKNFNRIKHLMDDAIEKGAIILLGGKVNESGLYIEPTILDNVTLDMKIMQEEIFGPVLPLLTFKHIDQAVSIVNSLPKPLAFYILSNSRKNTEFILSNTSAGGTAINDLMITSVNQYLPFGGVNNSGMGKSNGKYSFIAFSNERGILKRKWGTFKMLYPPYNKTITSWIIKISRL